MNYFPDNVVFLRLRGFFASFFVKKCGNNFRIGRDVTLYNSSMIEIGNDVYIAKGNWFSAGSKIIIEDSVMFGPYNVIASANHSLKNNSYRYGETIQRPIVVGKGSWITSHCTITAGTTIGMSCLIEPNSRVRGSIPNHSRYTN
jgi:acetyltransferase-like isoleucine patch superfamily enzyme